MFLKGIRPLIASTDRRCVQCEFKQQQQQTLFRQTTNEQKQQQTSVNNIILQFYD